MSTDLELCFLGTGTSTGLPLATCLTLSEPYPSSVVAAFAPPPVDPKPGQWNPNGSWPVNIPCGSCRASVDKAVPEGWKNRRGNPSIVLRRKNAEGRTINVIVDVGKTFREQAIKYFPQWGVQTIDAVILTHGHADAFFGLDDLRDWCSRRKTLIPIYCNRATYDVVAGAFPYMVDKTKASGGGDIPSFNWIIIEDESEFEVEGISVKTLPVHHGIYFTPPPLPALTAHFDTQSLPAKPPKHVPTPLICLGFIFDNSVVYLSDLNHLPDSTWSRIIPTSRPTDISSTISNLELNNPYTVLIIDTLFPTRTHPSHINFPQALEIAKRINANVTYMLGFTHPTTHHQWEALGREVAKPTRTNGGSSHIGDEHPESYLARDLVEKVWGDEQLVSIEKEIKEWGGRVEPAWDGLVLELGKGRDGWVEGRSAVGWGL